MLAPRTLPDRYATWNREHLAPYGRRGKRLIGLLGPRNRFVARYLGPYAWQTNNTLRIFEYPWAYEQLAALGNRLSVVDVGAGLAGFQFSLGQAGHAVHAVDPGMAARGRGSWELDPDQHAFLAKVYGAPVTLHPTTLAGAGLPDHSMDAIVSISTIEHFAPEDLAEFARETRRLLRPGGHLVLTIDLFLDVAPFTTRESNEYGVNFDVKRLLDEIGATLVAGEPGALVGYGEFDPDRVQSNLSQYLIGSFYPALSQCLVARVGGQPAQ
jgi:SAM-dependent methyltransferase